MMCEIDKETLPCLKAMQKKIQQGWCQRAFARNVDDFETDCASEDACKWCIMGAFMSIAGEEELFDSLLPHVSFAIRQGIKQVCPDLEFMSLVDYNDKYCSSQEEMEKVFEEAIEWADMQEVMSCSP